MQEELIEKLIEQPDWHPQDFFQSRYEPLAR